MAFVERLSKHAEAQGYPECPTVPITAEAKAAMDTEMERMDEAHAFDVLRKVTTLVMGDRAPKQFGLVVVPDTDSPPAQAALAELDAQMKALFGTESRHGRH